MPGYKSNAHDVINKVKARIQEVDKSTVSKIVRTIATDLTESNLFRIHNEGKAVDGGSIGTYKDSTKKIRKEAGKETEYMNFSFTGKLSKEFNQVAVNDREINIGFTTDYAAELSGHLEAKVGKKVWGATEEDYKVAEEIEKDLIRKALV